jgi:hypothetical protein
MKNSLACVIFKKKKSINFAIILMLLEKWENHTKMSDQKALVVL